MLKRQSEFREDVRTNMRGGKGAVKLSHIWTPGEEMSGHFRMFSTITLEPGCSIGYHVHEQEEEIFVVVQGTAEFNDNGTQKVLNKGDSTITRSGEGHSIASVGNETLVVLAVIGTY